ncbi:hypothetical protein [Methanobacterium formicicum]|uniref:Uncharacterized protein n=1 Tax=Methanobacterium formicicum TaxID=2162 RepID=A0A843AGJ0_METFO|nr:hypothetical protein [Methanobacterium formicicum]MBF4474267.1 hypothetical protein [Methanobacterium formicicum]
MANKEQVIQHIKFSLDQLSSRNAHHDFEHLCRHLTRARICSNVLPSTGPVSAGGDQGRDFETFKTFLDSNLSSSNFIGLASDKVIVFGCSLQKDKVAYKIKSDVKKIMDYDSVVDQIIFFSTSNLVASEMHELKKWVRENYSIDIDIHDINSISELLSDNDTFWIAAHFLNIPSEIYPKSDSEDNWYTKSYNKWKETDPFNYADFYEIKEAIRYATQNNGVKQDITFWIDVLSSFQNTDFPEPLKRLSIYETVVAFLKGFETLIGHEAIIREYFSVIENFEKFNDFDDAVALLNYCIGAFARGKIDITFDELSRWHEQLLTNLENKLNVTTEIGKKCQFLELRGFMTFYPTDNEFVIDFTETVSNWLELVEIVDNAPFFPLDRFSDRLTAYSKYIGDDSNYDKLTKKVDKLLSERYGGFKAAEKCLNRAMVFHDNNGEVLRAINQLHQAKIKWFADETLHKAIVSMFFISKGYLELGLTFASKYYALAAAYMAYHAADERYKVPMARYLFQAGICDYIQGSYCGFFDLVYIAFMTHLNFSKNPFNIDQHEKLNETLYYAAILIFTTRKFANEELTVFIQKMLDRCPQFKDVVEEDVEIVSKSFAIDNFEDLWNEFEENFSGRPFGDTGLVRNIVWSELGIEWKVSWQNNYILTSLGEQFVATLQIFLADIANIDLCLLKSNIDVVIAVDDNIDKPKANNMPSNEGRKWKVFFPSAEGVLDMEKLQNYIIPVISSILYENSLLPNDKFQRVIEDHFKKGISMKVFVGRPYMDLYRFFIDEETFEYSNRSSMSPPEPHRDFKINTNEELNWFAGIGPGYNKDEVNEVIKNRYEKSLIPIKTTLKRLLQNQDFVSTVKELKNEGWLDWHILSVVATRTINYKAKMHLEKYQTLSPIDPRIQFQMEVEILMNEEEDENSEIVPLHLFKKESLVKCGNMNMISTIKGLGLECHQETPDFEAINHFLSERYNYWTDDVEHDDPFKT